MDTIQADGGKPHRLVVIVGLDMSVDGTFCKAATAATRVTASCVATPIRDRFRCHRRTNSPGAATIFGCLALPSFRGRVRSSPDRARVQSAQSIHQLDCSMRAPVSHSAGSGGFESLV